MFSPGDEMALDREEYAEYAILTRISNAYQKKQVGIEPRREMGYGAFIEAKKRFLRATTPAAVLAAKRIRLCSIQHVSIFLALIYPVGVNLHAMSSHALLLENESLRDLLETGKISEKADEILKKHYG